MNMTKDLIPTLLKNIEAPLPGLDAQFKMAHIRRRDIYPLTPPDDVRIACVLMLLYPKNETWHFVLIKRMSTHPEDKHSGQVSFPGGQLEEHDESLAAGALREAEEEVGVKADDISLIGRMTELYIPVSNFLVHPFIGYLNYAPAFVRQETEVKAVIEAPLSLLLNEETRQLTTLKILAGIVLNDVPHFNIQGHVVWGATAMMLSEFVEILRLE